MRRGVHQWEIEKANLTQANPQLDEVVGLTYPHLIERIFRSSPQKVEVIQQPKTILLQGATTLSPVPNPDTILVRYSGSTSYAELIPSVSDVLGQANATQAAGLDISKSKKAICKFQENSSQEKLLDCLLRVGAANRLGRLLSGVKGTFNYGQNPQIQQNFLVNGTPAASKNFSLSGQVDFDPRGVILTGTDWWTAYQAAKAYGPAVESAMRARVRETCKLQLDRAPSVSDEMMVLQSGCLTKLARPQGKAIAGIFLTPQFSEVVRNQFDFIKQNGTLVAAPYPTNSLQDVTFTLDLTRLFPSLKARTDALQVLAAFKKPVAPPKNDLRLAVATKFQELAWQPESLTDDTWYQGFFKALLSGLRDGTDLLRPRVIVLERVTITVWHRILAEGRSLRRERPQHALLKERVDSSGKRAGENPKGTLPHNLGCPQDGF